MKHGFASRKFWGSIGVEGHIKHVDGPPNINKLGPSFRLENAVPFFAGKSSIHVKSWPRV